MASYRKFAYVYDELMQDMPYPDWLRFARQAWDQYGMPHTVAELGCGTGSITIPLVNSGFEVAGIDLSSDMLAVARRKMETTPQGQRLFREGSVRWIQQDMREWILPEPVDSVISFCDCLNYLLEEEDIISTFRRTHAGLKPGGTFLFDVHHPQTFYVMMKSSLSYWMNALSRISGHVRWTLPVVKLSIILVSLRKQNKKDAIYTSVSRKYMFNVPMTQTG